MPTQRRAVATTVTRTTLAVLALLALLLAALIGPSPVTAQTPDDDDRRQHGTRDAPDDDDAAPDDETEDDADERDRDDEQFTDVDRDGSHNEGISFLFDTGVTKGCGPDSYCPDEPVTRGEFATFVYRLAGEDDGVPVFEQADDLNALREDYEELADDYTRLQADYARLALRVRTLESAAAR